MSSRLELSKDEKESLIYLMNEAVLNSNYELEGIISSNLNTDDFKRIISGLNNNKTFKTKKEIERLDHFS